MTLGAITTSTFSCSRSQASARTSSAQSKAPPARKTTSTSLRSATSASALVSPSSGSPRAVARAGLRRGQHRADHVVAQPGLPAQHGGDLVHVALGAGDDHPVPQRAVRPGPVQQVPQGVAAQHQQRHTHDEGEHEEAPGQLELGQVAADADQRHGGEGGVDDPLVLVQAGAEDRLPVAAGGQDRRHPGHQHRRAGVGEVLGDVHRALQRRERLAPGCRREHAGADHQQVEAEGDGRDVAQGPACGCQHRSAGSSSCGHAQTPGLARKSLGRDPHC